MPINNISSNNGNFDISVEPQEKTSRSAFVDALITEVTVPKLDGSSKDAAYFDLEWEAETVRWQIMKKMDQDIERQMQSINGADSFKNTITPWIIAERDAP
ncbi:MAG: hypothetical protein AB1489_33965 [Acidobacteriota bacterium]